MGYADNDSAATSMPFRSQVRMAVLNQAQAVAGEAGTTTNHANRLILATRVLNQLSEDYLTQWARVVASDGSTLPGATDSAILARVAALWDALAGS